MARLSRELGSVLEDECYGLLSQPQRPGTFRMLCNTVINGETIGESLQLYVDFLNVIGSPLRPGILKSELEWRVVLVVFQPLNCGSEAACFGLARRCEE